MLLAQQAEAISPDHKEAALSLVTGVGAAVSMVLNPLWGAFSDRTVLRVGRRLPWVRRRPRRRRGRDAACSSSADSVLGDGARLGARAGGAERDARRDHRHRPRPGAARAQRGAVGGWLAIAQTLGVVAGSGIAAATGSIAAGYLATAGVARRARRCRTASTAATSRSTREDREPFDLGRFVRSFWVSPRQHPDFAWAWITRFLMNLGNALLILYLLYYLQDAVDLTDDEAEHGVFAADRRLRRCARSLTAVRRRRLVGPARPPQGLRDRLRPGRRVARCCCWRS